MDTLNTACCAPSSYATAVGGGTRRGTGELEKWERGGWREGSPDGWGGCPAFLFLLENLRSPNMERAPWPD